MVRVVVVRLLIVLIILIFIFNLYTTTRSILQLIPSSASSSHHQQQQHETKLWQQLPFTHFHSCVNPSSNYQAFHGRGRYITIRSNGGLNQMRTGIADMVAVSRIMNATLVIPELDKRSFWQDKSIFSDIFDEHHFIDSLKWDVTVIKKLPEELLSVPRARKHFTSWGSLSYYQEMTKLWEDYQAYAVLVRNFDVRLSALAVTAHALQSFDVGQQKIVSFTATLMNRFMANAKKPRTIIVHQIFPQGQLEVVGNLELPGLVLRETSRHADTIVSQVIHVPKSDSRLANNDLPLDIQRLRCRALYHALRFSPSIETLGKKLVERLKSHEGRYISLHLRYEKDMLAFSGCTYGLSDAESKELRLLRENTNHWKVKKINSTEQRRLGLCPLTPKEVGVFLQALGYPRSTVVYIAAGEIYGGKTHLSELTSLFPNVLFKEMVATEEELRVYSNHASQTAALDYIISLESDVFVPTHSGNMARAVEGHRRFLGHRKTISPDRWTRNVIENQRPLGTAVCEWPINLEVVGSSLVGDMGHDSTLKGEKSRFLATTELGSMETMTFPKRGETGKRGETWGNARETSPRKGETFLKLWKNKQIPQDSVRTTSAVDLEECCEKHYEKLLPIMADNMSMKRKKKSWMNKSEASTWRCPEEEN
ncbi:O-fucosyltransferase 38 [Tanacetum coccineum]|uniref:O-fucosyltransferase family protein n=1 Tax=Tanacetum coccineum TaxID=301880 RepID=A0ABQ4X4P7_9ASTR